jgi:hypothetical protein
MKNVIVNGNTAEVRKLNPFTYADTIKSLHKSNEARVVIDGAKVFRSAVTSGRDVKAFTGMKYHVYFYITEADSKIAREGGRSWMPITKAEFDAYKHDPAFVLDITTVAAPAPVEAEQTPAKQATPTKAKGRKAQREAAPAA